MSKFTEIMFLVADLTIIVCFAAAVIFVVSYATFFHWRKTKAGRALMYLFLAWIAVTVIAGLARFLGPDFWGREWFRVVGWAVVAFALINLIRVLWYNYRQGLPPLSMTPKNDTSAVPVQKEDSHGAA